MIIITLLFEISFMWRNNAWFEYSCSFMDLLLDFFIKVFSANMCSQIAVETNLVSNVTRRGKVKLIRLRLWPWFGADQVCTLFHRFAFRVTCTFSDKALKTLQGLFSWIALWKFFGSVPQGIFIAASFRLSWVSDLSILLSRFLNRFQF